MRGRAEGPGGGRGMWPAWGRGGGRGAPGGGGPGCQGGGGSLGAGRGEERGCWDLRARPAKRRLARVGRGMWVEVEPRDKPFSRVLQELPGREWWRVNSLEGDSWPECNRGSAGKLPRSDREPPAGGGMGRLPQAAPGPPRSSGKQARGGLQGLRGPAGPRGRACARSCHTVQAAAVGGLPLRAHRRADSLRGAPESRQARPREGRAVLRGGRWGRAPPSRTRLPAPLRRRPRARSPAPAPPSVAGASRPDGAAPTFAGSARGGPSPTCHGNHPPPEPAEAARGSRRLCVGLAARRRRSRRALGRGAGWVARTPRDGDGDGAAFPRQGGRGLKDGV